MRNRKIVYSRPKGIYISKEDFLDGKMYGIDNRNIANKILEGASSTEVFSLEVIIERYRDLLTEQELDRIKSPQKN